MKQLLALLFISAICFSCGKPEQVPSKPNIIYILADDLGYGELGIYGQTKIQTPNIDALAKSGMMFTQHYSGAPVCAPARYMLMTPSEATMNGQNEAKFGTTKRQCTIRIWKAKDQFQQVH